MRTPASAKASRMTNIYPGPAPDSAPKRSKSASLTTATSPTASNKACTARPRSVCTSSPARAVMPAPIEAGVFGIALNQLACGIAASRVSKVIPAATEIITVP